MEDKMAGRHHCLNGHEFKQTLGDSERQEDWSAAVPGVAELDETEGLNNNLISRLPAVLIACLFLHPLGTPVKLLRTLQKETLSYQN